MEYILLIFTLAALCISLLTFLCIRKLHNDMNDIIKDTVEDALGDSTSGTGAYIENMSKVLSRVEVEQQEMSRKHAEALNRTTNDLISSKLDSMNSILKSDRENNREILEGNSRIVKTNLEMLGKTTETRLDTLTAGLNRNFAAMREENNNQIDKIRQEVRDKLDKTLNEQFEKSFKGVITQMNELQRSMGELQSISSQVGSLEKTLNGVKTKGILGEVQLKQIIADILTPSQYEVEYQTKPGSQDHVEIAIKLPERNSDRYVYLPIDSKCHLELYEQLLNAMDTGDPVLIKDARKTFRDAIKDDAEKIRSKYISVPDTTPYAILFVPFEGMYSEIVNLGLIDELNKLQITVAGPYTLTAILSTVTNYFQSLAIEKKSADIEKTLSNVKTAFRTFDEQLDKVSSNLDTATKNLEKLKTTRVNAINRALRGVTSIEDGQDEDGLFLT